MAEDVGEQYPARNPTIVDPSDNRATIDYTPKLTKGSAATVIIAEEASTELIRRYRIKAVGTDTLSCKLYNGVEETGNLILIAKPEDLRISLAVDGVVYTYISSTERIKATGDDRTLEQLVAPYVIDDIIYGMSVDGTGIDGVLVVDANVSGRNWQPDDSAQELVVTAQQNDYLECGDVKVAKPFELRRTEFDGRTVAGVTYTYSNAYTRSADDGVDTQTETIIPAYTNAKSTVLARPVVGGTGILDADSVEIMLVDVDCGRAWAAEV